LIFSDKLNKAMKKFLPILFSIVLSLFVLSPGEAYAISATMKTVPVSGNYDIGDTFTVAIRVNTGGQAINTVKAYLTFDTTLLKVNSISTAGSFVVGIWPENKYDNVAGTINLVGGVVPPGFTGADGLFATITFQALKAGVSQVNFSSSSAIRLLSDSSNVFDLTTSTSGVYTLVGGTGAGADDDTGDDDDYSDTSGSSGTSGGYHLACMNNACVSVSGSGANLNGCASAGASCSATAIDGGSVGPTALLGLAGLIFISLGTFSQLIHVSSMIKKSRVRSFEKSFYK